MHALTNWFIRNPVAANLLMGLIIFLGVMTTLSIRIEGFPRIPPESTIITTILPEATAEQVDELVTQKIEKALEGLEGVRSITAQSENSASTVVVRRAGGQDLDKLLDKIRLRLEGNLELPQSARKPIIETSEFDFPALYLNLHGDTDTATLQTLSERLRESLLAQPELSRLNVWGLHSREMRVEVNPNTLRQYDLTIADVAERIRANSLNFQSGTLRTNGGNIFLRADNRAKFSTEFNQIPILEQQDGTSILLGDISRIQDTVEEGDYLFRFNGYPTAGMEILVGQKENLLKISDVVHQVVEDFDHQLPPQVSISIWGDSSNYISDRLALLRSNGIQGLLLVALILSLFLNVRLAFWVAMGIPISVMGALAVSGSDFVGYSLNDITTFGLIIALGILVDDAVVVGESVFEERRKHNDPTKGTENGVAKVAVATVFGVLTTIAAFIPMLLLDNPLGKVLASFSGIVILALIFSLLESKFILPAHLAHINLNSEPRFLLSKFWKKIQGIAKSSLFFCRDKLYAPLLERALINRYATLIVFVSAATLGIGLIGLGKIKTVFFPDIPGQIISVSMEMDAHAPFLLTKQNMDRIETIGKSLNGEFKQEFDLAEAPIRTSFIIITSAESAQLYAELTPVADRPNVGILDIIDQWRERTGQLEGTTELHFSGTEDLAGGFQLKLLSKDRQQLAAASKELKSFLSNIDGVNNVRDALASGQPELSIKVKPEARNLGFNTDSLARQIGYAYGGAEVQKTRRNGTEFRVLVVNQLSDRDTMSDLIHSELRSDRGEWIPLQSVAHIKQSYVTSTVHRESGKLVNTVRASINRSTVAPEEIGQAVFEQFESTLRSKYPSVTLSQGGELEEMFEIRSGLLKALLIAAVMIYVLMAIPLKSYWQPFLILAIVPFGFIGAALGHLIMDLPLSLLSFFGMLALTGVVINDSLVMITRYNQAKAEGLNLHDAIKEAGVGRFQAIFLTTATTVIGLVPLMTETSEQAQYLIPAAVSLAFGELFSTALMLILVPVLIAITDDIKPQKVTKTESCEYLPFNAQSESL